MESLAAIEDEVAAVVRVREARSEAFGAGLFSDPAWDILLTLYEARLAGRSVRSDQLSPIAPGSTLARWLAVLQDRGLVSCEQPAPVSPDLVVALSDAGEARMTRLFRHNRPAHATA
jgi:hypothetical protein